MAYDPETSSWHLSVSSAMILSRASTEALAHRVHDEVVEQLVGDPDFRILVREGVREAMNKLNVTEVVEAAVKQVLGEWVCEAEARKGP